MGGRLFCLFCCLGGSATQSRFRGRNDGGTGSGLWRGGRRVVGWGESMIRKKKKGQDEVPPPHGPASRLCPAGGAHAPDFVGLEDVALWEKRTRAGAA